MYTGEREVRVTRKTNNTENLKIDKIVFAQTLSVGFFRNGDWLESTRYFYWLRRMF